MKSTINDVAIYGGDTNLHIALDVPIRIIIKEKIGVRTIDDVLDQVNTYGWKFEYHGRWFGDYMVFQENISDRSNQGTRLLLNDLYQIEIEQATDAFLHTVLLSECCNENIMDELRYRIDDRYLDVELTVGRKYSPKFRNPDGHRIYLDKLSFKYIKMKVQVWFYNLLVSILYKILS